MPAAPIPADEAERLAVLHGLDLLGEESDGLFDRAAGLVSSLFGGICGTVALVDAETVRYPGATGIAFRRFPRSRSLCAHALAAPLWIEDVSKDARLSDIAAGAPIPIVFYAGAPILVAGKAVGSLCVAASTPRAYDAALAERLQDLAALVSDTMSLRAALTARTKAERVAKAYRHTAPVAAGAISEAQAAAEHSQRRLALALDMSGTGVWEVDVAKKTLFATGPAIHLLGRELNYETVYRRIFDLCHPDDQPWVRRAWRVHLETGAPYDVEHRLLRPDGEDIWIHVFVEAIRGPDGRIARILGALRDVTGAKRAELDLARATREAQAANFAKSEFLANMSHELRTPLNGVTGVTGALARTPLDPQQQEMVGLIEASADALSRLLSDVLDLARVDSGRLELHPEPFELESFAQGVGMFFQWRAKEKGVAFHCEVKPEAFGGYVADTVRLRQILANLLANAVKFTAAGEVRLVVAPGPQPGELVFTVSDTGIGFTPEQRTRLFERFSQGDGSITRRFGGSGLGLAISRALAIKMGGRLEARGEPGEGAVFTLTLPLERTSSRRDPAEHSPQPAAAPHPGARVLLAEDHPINRKVVELILGSAGVNLVSVENGQEAVDALEREAFDLVLMDTQMPVMDGLTAIRTLRARERDGGRRTPVISLTANALPDHVRAALAAGADAHIVKPISAPNLLKTVFRLIEAADPISEESAAG